MIPNFGSKIDLRESRVSAWQGSEHDLQKHICKWAKLMEGQYPELRLLHAIPNGGQRHVLVATKLKAEGVKAGVPDICLPVARGGYHGLYIEVKRSGGKPSLSQSGWIADLVEQGYRVAIINDAQTVKDLIITYLKKEAS